MELHVLLSMAVALGIAAATPGPGVLAIVSRAIGYGFRDASVMTAGIVLGDTLYFLAALTGWSAVAQMFGDVFSIIRVVAAIALIFMGCHMVKGSFSPKISIPTTHATSTQRVFIAGFLLTLGNPKTMLFYLAFLPTFINLSNVDAWGALSLVGVIFTIVSGVMLTYAAIGARAAKGLKNPSVVRWLQRSAGATLIGTGAIVATRS
ncbi:MAG: LysE family translocator [Rhodospirillaceae bacterium]|nr:LysE family translocator [Rhodospirillaceae bacterium]